MRGVSSSTQMNGPLTTIDEVGKPWGEGGGSPTSKIRNPII